MKAVAEDQCVSHHGPNERASKYTQRFSHEEGDRYDP